MSDREFEATVWCPECKADKFTLYRVQRGSPGHYVHEIDPEGAQRYKCECGTVLERRIDG